MDILKEIHSLDAGSFIRTEKITDDCVYKSLQGEMWDNIYSLSLCLSWHERTETRSSGCPRLEPRGCCTHGIIIHNNMENTEWPFYSICKHSIFIDISIPQWFFFKWALQPTFMNANNIDVSSELSHSLGITSSGWWAELPIFLKGPCCADLQISICFLFFYLELKRSSTAQFL